MGDTQRPGSLPHQLTRFVGRDAEREQIRAALQSSRLLALTGPGGAGKTRLALWAAEDIAAEVAVWWVELAPVTDAGQVGAALARALGVRALPGRTDADAVVDHVREARALIVLDNCEHVLEAAADLAEALLRGCPNTTVMATSRTRLGVPGETDWSVPALSPEDAATLFAERASNVGRFEVAADDAPVIEEICRELDGMPLAIELAAARTRMFSVAQIADGLRDRFRLLTDAPRGTLPRQQTLRASVDWSHDLLADDERRLFRRLAVFVGGWTLEAADAVCGEHGDGVLGSLTGLVDKSLIEPEPHGGAARFRMLETVRQYAAGLLEESGELGDVRDRHRDHFAGLAAESARQLEMPRNLGWPATLEPDAANLAAAIDHALATQPKTALRMGVALTSWWEVGGRFGVGQTALTRALEAADPAPSAERALATWSVAHLARFGGDLPAVREHVPLSLKLAEEVGDRPTIARALVTLSHLTMMRDPDGSRAMLQRAIGLARECGDLWPLVHGLSTLGRLHIVTDEFDEADRLFGELVGLDDRAGVEAVSWGASGLCWGAMVRGDHRRVTELAEQSLAASRAVGDPTTEAFVHAVAAHDDVLQGRAQDALARMQESLVRIAAAGAGFTFPLARTELARAYAAAGDLDRADELLEVVIAGGADGGWLLGRAIVLLADVRRVQDDGAGARALAEQGRALGQSLGPGAIHASAQEVLARLAVADGDPRTAETLLHEALVARVDRGLLPWLPPTLEALALVAADLESHPDAARLLGAAAAARTVLGTARWAPDTPAIEALEAALTARLGPEAADAARRAGAALDLDEAVGWVRRARGTRKRPADGWASLTPTELQVVELVSQGLTNPQIAERMFVSRATVKTHLIHVFRKLGVQSRAELAASTVQRAK